VAELDAGVEVHARQCICAGECCNPLP
jgi:hypothetical protein